MRKRSHPLVGSSNLPLRTFCSDGLLHRVEVPAGAGPMSYGHTTVKAPHPIRTAKLSTVGPDQYFGRGLQGNLGCCMSLFFSSLRNSHKKFVWLIFARLKSLRNGKVEPRKRSSAKIGTIQRRLAWPLRKDDTQNREAFHIFASAQTKI